APATPRDRRASARRRRRGRAGARTGSRSRGGPCLPRAQGSPGPVATPATHRRSRRRDRGVTPTATRASPSAVLAPGLGHESEERAGQDEAAVEVGGADLDLELLDEQAEDLGHRGDLAAPGGEAVARGHEGEQPPKQRSAALLEDADLGPVRVEDQETVAQDRTQASLLDRPEARLGLRIDDVVAVVDGHDAPRLDPEDRAGPGL